MRGADEEVAVERLHIDVEVGRALRAVDHHIGAYLAGPLGDQLDGVVGAEHIGDLGERDNAGAVCDDRGQRLELQLARIGDGDGLERSARELADHVPGDDVGVVLHLGDHDLVARLEGESAEAAGDEVEPLGATADEDDFGDRAAVHEGAAALAGRLIHLGCGLAGGVDAAPDGRILRGIEPLHAVDDLLGLLGRRRCVEVGVGLSVHQLLEHREVLLQALAKREGHGLTRRGCGRWGRIARLDGLALTG